MDITVQDRVPRVPVPAEYLGAAVLPTSGFYDLWLAGDPDTALAAAEVLNEALAQKLGPEGKLAGTRGQVVSAVGGNVQIDNPEEILRSAPLRETPLSWIRNRLACGGFRGAANWRPGRV